LSLQKTDVFVYLIFMFLLFKSATFDSHTPPLCIMHLIPVIGKEIL